MAQDKNDTVQFSTLWAASSGWTDEQKKSFASQIKARIPTMPVSHLQEVLDQAPTGTKTTIWAWWVKTADLSGHSLPDIISLNDTEPPAAVYTVVSTWLEQVDLSKYDLPTVKRTASMLRGADIPKLWKRWVDSADLSAVNLIVFCKSIQDLSPEYQAVCLKGFIAHADMNKYSTQDKDSACKYIAAWAADQSGLRMSAKSKYGVGDTVTVVNTKYTGRVLSITQVKGVSAYSIEGYPVMVLERGLA
jgi:hypothetical protein